MAFPPPTDKEPLPNFFVVVLIAVLPPTYVDVAFNTVVVVSKAP